MEKIINVYLAGKISSNGWREKIISMRRDENLSNFEYTYDKIKNHKIKYNDSIDIVGPFFINCDHSCYHGENCHGVGIEKNTCIGEKTFTQSQVYSICTYQIRKSDIVFAYIDDNTCYGSLFELGYAASLNKPILILYSNKKTMKDMWFINQSSYHYDIIINYDNIKEAFHEMINDFCKKSN